MTKDRNPFLDHDSWALVHLVGPQEKKSLARLELAGRLHATDLAQIKAVLRLLFDLA